MLVWHGVVEAVWRETDVHLLPYHPTPLAANDCPWGGETNISRARFMPAKSARIQ